jgi:PPOX class probable F420-dependent enzyme
VWHGPVVLLDADACWERLRSTRNGVLGTVHAQRGADLVPVVYVVDGTTIVLPIDTVKPKSGARLQRLRNLEADARASVLIDHYDDDWQALWWVRAHGTARLAAPTTKQLERLATSFPAYRDPGSVASVVLVEVDEVTGWAAIGERLSER